jgi:pyridoxine 5-phosphate synthase
MPKLGVNIDHVATLRKARGEGYPDPVKAAHICLASGADSIVCHLRQDRRHIRDEDVFALRKCVKTKFNLEMSVADEIVKIALKVKPDQVTLVPEKRKELTTEGGLDVIRYGKKIKHTTDIFRRNNIDCNLFIDPDKEQIDASKASGAKCIELHTGRYANARGALMRKDELNRLCFLTSYAKGLGLTVNAGHGLDYKNASAVSKIPFIEELNIGFSIISAAIFIGIEQAVKEMKKIIS